MTNYRKISSPAPDHRGAARFAFSVTMAFALCVVSIIALEYPKGVLVIFDQWIHAPDHYIQVERGYKLTVYLIGGDDANTAKYRASIRRFQSKSRNSDYVFRSCGVCWL